MKYIITLRIRKLVKVGEEYQYVDVETDFTYYNWDDVQNFIGYMVDGREGKTVSFDIKTEITEEKGLDNVEM